MSGYISYKDVLENITSFKKSGTPSGSEFNLFDQPGHKYFKIFFYFDNGDVTGELRRESGTGLLSPTWLMAAADNPLMYYKYNSAWSYLKMNDEEERVDLLVEFVNLLSNINSESPWYFSEISGLESALERKQVMAETFNIEQTRPKISIKCLADSFDDRIGTLLDLYRAIIWDWQTKREMIPANLRKFDMGILIFETPSVPFHTESLTNTNKKYANIGGITTDNYSTSYKYIELHNCEIDYNSTKNVYSQLDNVNGKSMEYVIDIHFDDCYEMRYNEFMLKSIGDIVQITDNDANFVTQEKLLDEKINYFNKNNPQEKTQNNQSHNIFEDSYKKDEKSELKNKKKVYPKKGFLSNALTQLTNVVGDAITSKAKRIILGNIYTFSLTDLKDQIKTLASGDIVNTIATLDEYAEVIRDQNKKNQKLMLSKSNLFEEPVQNINETPKPNIFYDSSKPRITPTVKKLGNLAQNKSIANNT